MAPIKASSASVSHAALSRVADEPRRIPLRNPTPSSSPSPLRLPGGDSSGSPCISLTAAHRFSAIRCASSPPNAPPFGLRSLSPSACYRIRLMHGETMARSAAMVLLCPKPDQTRAGLNRNRCRTARTLDSPPIPSRASGLGRPLPDPGSALDGSSTYCKAHMLLGPRFAGVRRRGIACFAFCSGRASRRAAL